MATDPLYLSSSSGLPESGTGVVDGSGLQTGDLRRKYDFSEQFSELSIDQTPFFRLVSKINSKPTDDPEFKYTEKRGSWHKRYAYVNGFKVGAGAWAAYAEDVTLTFDENIGALALNDEIVISVVGDYTTAGNLQSVYGNTAIAIGASGTEPNWILKNQIIKIPMKNAVADTYPGSYALAMVVAHMAGETGGTNADMHILKAQVIKASSDTDLGSYTAAGTLVAPSTTDPEQLASSTSVTTLEQARSYIVGNGYEEGSGLSGETWKDNPYSTSYGQTQIWRLEFGMTNTSRATVLKYEGNEWARIWREKLIEHKWDIETSALFGTQRSSTVDGKVIPTTQGALDFVQTAGNIFKLNLASKTADDFLEDLGRWSDPRYNNSKNTIFFCDTATYNWLHKLGGYFKNNVEISTNFNADIAVTGKRKMFGVDLTTISTVYGDMNVARNIHLDGTGVRILACNMANVAWRPLKGNGVNRDTSIYVGVQSLENTGVDKRVDMILTEGGFEWKMPESHAMWQASN
jgi:hypothetical protein